MELDQLIQKLRELRKQGTTRVYLSPDRFTEPTRIIEVDTDREGDLILIGE